MKVWKSVPSRMYKGEMADYIVYEDEDVDNEVLDILSREGGIKGCKHRWLALLYQEAKKAQSILELGIWQGRSTLCLLLGLRNGNQGSLYSIDDCRHGYTEETVAYIKRRGFSPYFTWIKKDFFDIPEDWFRNHQMDLVVIDFDEADYNVVVDRCLLSLKEGGKLYLRNLGTGRGELEAIRRYNSSQDFELEEVWKGYHEAGHPCGFGILTRKRG